MDAVGWTDLHRLSEQNASEAQARMAAGHHSQAMMLYAKAAAFEEKAMVALGGDRPRTYAITAVSAAWLWYKSGDVVSLVAHANSALARPDLLAFARSEIQEALSQGLGRAPATVN